MKEIRDKIDAVVERFFNEQKILMEQGRDKRFKAFREILSILEKENPILRKIYFFLYTGGTLMVAPLMGITYMFVSTYKKLNDINNANEFVKRYGTITLTGDQ